MKNRVKFTDHDGIEMLFLDFSKISASEVLQVIDTASKAIESRPLNSLRILSDVTDARFDTNVSDQMKEFTKQRSRV